MEAKDEKSMTSTQRTDAWIGSWDLLLRLLGAVDADIVTTGGALAFRVTGGHLAGLDGSTGQASTDIAPAPGGDVFVPGGVTFSIEGRPVDLVAFLACSGRGQVVEIVSIESEG